jgi:hypothetical protein
MLVAYENAVGEVFIKIKLPSGKEWPNVYGWGDRQWDSLLSVAAPADTDAIASLKASWDTLSKSLIKSSQDKIDENKKAREDYKTLVANWGKTAGTGTSKPTGKVADDDSGG